MKEVKEHTILCRITDKQRKKLEAHCSNNKMSVSKWIRERINKLRAE